MNRKNDRLSVGVSVCPSFFCAEKEICDKVEKK